MTTLAPSLARWLGAADSKAPDHLWETPDVSAPAILTARTGVLTISGMPRALRPRIETAMVLCLSRDSALEIPGADPLTSDWFTPWRRSGGRGPGLHVACRQVLTGTPEEFERLRAIVDNLADRYCFDAELALAG
ncbi:hypothetical protein [Corynebacterium nasicanis]|uniref:Uncharacterized protein n=1 Tax=Corynebacterium nasicanis TaxID=1448267 RepID=A0ABW1QAB8_9CORY